MVTARAATKGLSTTDLEQIRDTLGSGRKPKVMFTDAAGQIAGQIGQVVSLTDPELSDEFVVVRFGKDELPFSPIDLMIAPKVAATRRTNTVPAPREESPVPAPAPPLSTVDSPVEPSPSPPVAAPAPPVEEPAAGEPVAEEPKKVVRATPAKKAVKPKVAPGLTVTLAYAEGEWTVAANQGAKALAKPYLIKPAEALKMVSMLDVPGVHEAVEEIVSAARAEAEQQAERLRAELAEIEARLAELSETD
jgi:hypothetical protein